LASEKEITPDELFQLFRNAFDQSDTEMGKTALGQFSLVKDKSIFLDPTIRFISTEPEDQVTSWGTNILEMIGGDKAFNSIIDILKNTNSSRIEKRKFIFTRFFALRAAKTLAIDDSKLGILKEWLTRIWPDEDEDYLVRAESLTILASQGDNKAKSEAKEWLSNPKDFWKTFRMLRALREFPIQDLADEVIAVLRTSDYTDHKYEAILVLGKLSGNLKAVRTLGEIARTDRRAYIRLLAFKSLASLNNAESVFDLIHGLTDTNAENRVQACAALKSILPKDEAISVIINEAFKDSKDDIAPYVEALRQIDPDRISSANILSRELSNEDRKRALVAEKMLIELGGWVAVQRLNQRRSTLDALDKLLNESEAVVKNTFEGTIKQAKRNFYFAMGVNILVVITGIILIAIATKQVLQDPAKFAEWIVPGATGVFGIITTMYFNDPRKNAREDLTTLMNVNIIFLGFLRQLNEIDATFKHAYLESQDFGTTQMNETVNQIYRAMNQTLILAANYLAVPKTFDQNEINKAIKESTAVTSSAESSD
jgi:HEAT repeat protein